MTSPARNYELCDRTMSECGLMGQPTCSFGDRCGAPVVDSELSVDFSNLTTDNMALATEAELAGGKPADYLNSPFREGWLRVLGGDPADSLKDRSPGRRNNGDSL